MLSGQSIVCAFSVPLPSAPAVFPAPVGFLADAYKVSLPVENGEDLARCPVLGYPWTWKEWPPSLSLCLCTPLHRQLSWHLTSSGRGKINSVLLTSDTAGQLARSSHFSVRKGNSELLLLVRWGASLSSWPVTPSSDHWALQGWTALYHVSSNLWRPD